MMTGHAIRAQARDFASYWWNDLTRWGGEQNWARLSCQQNNERHCQSVVVQAPFRLGQKRKTAAPIIEVKTFGFNILI